SKIKLLHNEGKKKSEKNIKSRLKYLFKKSTSAKKNIPTAKEKITNNKLIKKNKTKKIKKESIVSLKRKSGKDLLDRLTVAEVMKKAEVMDIDSLVVEVVREFSEKNCTGIFISKKEKIVGLIILPDILEILRKKKKIAKLKAGEIMGELICMNKKDSLSKAILGMHMHKSGCIAVKDHKKVIGVVTRSMILNKIAKNIFATENEGLVKNIIETKVDKLLDLLRKKETNMKELEEKLNLDNEKIEEWLEILKNHNLIKYKKSLFGKLLIENVK
ncbi:MAG: hypothetical protein DRP06_02960, partial [Candidatus Aenigmatarchaeota archaeon]